MNENELQDTLPAELEAVKSIVEALLTVKPEDRQRILRTADTFVQKQ